MLVTKSLCVALLHVICIFKYVLGRNHALFSGSWSRWNLTSIVADAKHPGHQIPKISSSNLHKNPKKIVNNRFNDSIVVDMARMVVKVGAACSMEKLLQKTIQHGLLPKVLPELKQITVGGAIVGAALESSSFRYGQFNDICKTITVLTGDSNEIICSRAQNSYLYNALAGSYGTLGRVVSTEVECIHAADNVLITAHVFTNISSALTFMNITTSSKSSANIDFVDGIIYPLQSGNSQQVYVILTASMQQVIRNDIPRCFAENHHSEFYYEYIQNQAQRVLRRCMESSFQFQMTLSAFLFRYDRGAFWMTKPISFSLSLVARSPMLIPLFIITHNNPLCRFLFRRLFTTSILYRLLNKAHNDVIARKMVIMDVYVPLSKLESFLQFINDHIPITTPLWICPIKRPFLQEKQVLSPHGVCPEEIMGDVGIYGRVADGEGKRYTRLLDQWCMEHGARKMLYSQHSYTKEDFWQTKVNPNGIYDCDIYRALREKYQVEKLP